jgi:hypothetical protein
MHGLPAKLPVVAELVSVIEPLGVIGFGPVSATVALHASTNPSVLGFCGQSTVIVVGFGGTVGVAVPELELCAPSPG